MTWFALLVAGLVLFAVAYDLIAHARRRYRPAAEWEEARLRRKLTGLSLRTRRSR